MLPHFYSPGSKYYTEEAVSFITEKQSPGGEESAEALSVVLL